MTKQDYINNITDIPANEIVRGIREGIVTYEELQETGLFVRKKQAEVRELLQEFIDEEKAFNNLKIEYNLSDYNDFLKKYPNSKLKDKVEALREQKLEEISKGRNQRLAEIKNNPNKYTIDEVKSKLGDDLFRQLCEELDLDYNEIINYQPTKLNFNMIPEQEKDIPKNYTDVFFWGIPSSGKTTALATIFRAINDKYVMEDDSTLIKQFGSSYRSDLINVYKEGLGFLPARTQKDRTQYMPFLLRRRNEKVKQNRKVSFFELSGEVFKHFLEIKDGLKDKSELNDEELEDRLEAEKSFKTIELLLKSENQKIHFFFIDYDKELTNLKKRNTKSQADYLSAAATYFESKGNIFSEKTKGVYIIITKADTIQGEKKTIAAAEFFNQHFGNFHTVIKGRCKEHSIKNPEIKLFSIGEVYFNKISKINYKYSENIIEAILQDVLPEEKSWFKRFIKK